MLARLANANIVSDPKRLEALLRHVWRHFREDESFEAAAALAYTSLLGLVPLLAIIFGTMSAFDVFSAWNERLRSFVFENFVPAFGEQVETYISGFVSQASGLTAFGFIALVVTSVLLMAKIEATFNRIWRVSTTRRPLNRFVIYWAVLTLGPLFMGASLGLSTYVAALPVLHTVGIGLSSSETLIKIGIFFMTWAAFTVIFTLVPNRSVNWRHAVIGGLVSVLLFELAKWVFGVYVTQSPTYRTLYGALATIPVFLVWIYVSWVVVLLGASVAAALTTFTYERERWRWPRELEFQLLFRLLGHFWSAQRHGQSLSEEDLLAREASASDSQLQAQLGVLHDAGWLRRDEAGGWFLVRDMGEASLEDLLATGQVRVPWQRLDAMRIENDWDEQLQNSLRRLRLAGGETLEQSLKSLYKPRPAVTPATGGAEHPPSGRAIGRSAGS